MCYVSLWRGPWPPILGLASHGRSGCLGHGHGGGIFPACDANFLLETDEAAKHRPREKAQHIAHSASKVRRGDDGQVEDQHMPYCYFLAARDTITATLTWVFYNLSQKPNVVSTIRNELSPIASSKAASSASAMVIFEPEETKSLVYLRAVLYETLRLYPPGPIECKTVATDDIMPSGHKVRSGDTIFISVHSMGRMEDLWGNDCLNYNPERWLSDNGNLRYVPSHKFLVFNSGPKICPGKEIAVMQMKTVIASTMWNFDVELMKGQSIQPKPSCILKIKNGLILKLKKRQM
uniref:Cytochrome P450 86A2 n=1 Tax=Aegilops tauschii subsp. strangulata TaxID=200361 RepID=A0A453A739_AEGTS